MRSINQLSEYLFKWGKIVEENVVKAHQETAKKICEDVKSIAPVRSGRYVSSIKVGETTVKDGVYNTIIYTDLPVGGNNPRWMYVPLGALIEWGTGIKGATTNTYPHGYDYRLTPWTYYDKYLHDYVETDGMIARPHFTPALFGNRKFYMDKLREAIRK